MILFGRTQTAIQTPFEPNRNPGFGGVPSEIESTDVQNAIEEAKQDALSNDRYVLLCSYGGNANTGRYLEFFPSIDSSLAPIYLPVQTKLLSIVASTTSNSNAVIGFFNLTVSSTVPVYTVNMNGTMRQTLVTGPGTPFYVFPAGSQVAVKIDTGAANKPYIYFFLGAST